MIRFNTMDLLMTCLLIIFVSFVIFSLCGWCCKRSKPDTTFTTVTVPGATTVEVVPQAYQNPPYPVQQSMMPQPITGVPPHQVYMAPYPPVNQTTYLPVAGFNSAQLVASYPSYPGYSSAAGNVMQHQDPPSYDEATSGSNVFGKQAAYNPNFK